MVRFFFTKPVATSYLPWLLMFWALQCIRDRDTVGVDRLQTLSVLYL